MNGKADATIMSSVEKLGTVKDKIDAAIHELLEVHLNENRWESGFRSIVTGLYGPSAAFDIPTIVDTVGGLKAELDSQRARAIAAENALASRRLQDQLDPALRQESRNAYQKIVLEVIPEGKTFVPSDVVAAVKALKAEVLAQQVRANDAELKLAQIRLVAEIVA